MTVSPPVPLSPLRGAIGGQISDLGTPTKAAQPGLFKLGRFWRVLSLGQIILCALGLHPSILLV